MVMKKSGKVAIFKFNENDKDLIKDLSKFIDSHAQEIFDFFEIEKPKEKAVINIIPTKEEYDNFIRTTRKLSSDYAVPKWLIGTCQDGVITYLSLNDYKNTSHSFNNDKYDEALEYYKKTILHEFIHYVNECFNKIHKCQDTEKYLQEGIATYLSGQYDGKTILLNATKEQILDEKQYYYDDYYLITKYLIENYDKSFVLKMFQNKELARECLVKELFDRTQKFYK